MSYDGSMMLVFCVCQEIKRGTIISSEISWNAARPDLFVLQTKANSQQPKKKGASHSSMLEHVVLLKINRKLCRR